MPNVYKTVDNQNFVSVGNAPDQIKQLIWQGLPGKYIAVTAAGLLTTIDYGATWGYIYPNTEFATALPGGALGYQTAFAIGPRGGGNCLPGIGNCDNPSALDFSVSDFEMNNGSSISQILMATGSNLTGYNGWLIYLHQHVSGGIPTVPTIVTDGTPTTSWTLINTILFDSNQRRLSAWVGDSIDGTIPDVDAVFNEVQTNARSVLLGITSQDIIKIQSQAVSGSNDSPATTLNTFSNANSATLFLVANDAIDDALGSSMSEHSWYGGSGINMHGFWQAGENLTPSASFGGLPHEWGVIAIEVVGCTTWKAVFCFAASYDPASFNSIDPGSGDGFASSLQPSGINVFVAIKDATAGFDNIITGVYTYGLDDATSVSSSTVELVLQTIGADDVIIVAVAGDDSPGEPTLTDTENLPWTLVRSQGSADDPSLVMYVYSAKANAAVVAVGTTLIIDFLSVQPHMNAIAVAMQDSTNPTNPVIGWGAGDESPVLEVTGDPSDFSPAGDHTWNLNDTTASVGVGVMLK